MSNAFLVNWHYEEAWEWYNVGTENGQYYVSYTDVFLQILSSIKSLLLIIISA